MARLTLKQKAVLRQLRDDPNKVARAAIRELRRLTGIKQFHICLVFGSGWDAAVRKLGRKLFEFDATRFPGFLPPGVKGHAGKIRIYKLRGKYVLVFRGRKHLYEFKEHEPWMEACMHYVRVAHFAGCKIYIHTNAVGGLRPDLKVGQAVIIRNHNKIIGHTPTSLRGLKFLDCSRLYHARLRKLCLKIDPSLVEGVIAQVSGPEFETSEDAEYLAMHGVTVVGMSMIPENLLANHFRMRFLGISVVTDPAGTKVSHQEVLAVLKRRAPKLGGLIKQTITRM